MHALLASLAAGAAAGIAQHHGGSAIDGGPTERFNLPSQATCRIHLEDGILSHACDFPGYVPRNGTADEEALLARLNASDRAALYAQKAQIHQEVASYTRQSLEQLSRSATANWSPYIRRRKLSHDIGSGKGGGGTGVVFAIAVILWVVGGITGCVLMKKKKGRWWTHFVTPCSLLVGSLIASAYFMAGISSVMGSLSEYCANGVDPNTNTCLANDPPPAPPACYDPLEESIGTCHSACGCSGGAAPATCASSAQAELPVEAEPVQLRQLSDTCSVPVYSMPTATYDPTDAWTDASELTPGTCCYAERAYQHMESDLQPLTPESTCAANFHAYRDSCTIDGADCAGFTTMPTIDAGAIFDTRSFVSSAFGYVINSMWPNDGKGFVLPQAQEFFNLHSDNVCSYLSQLDMSCSIGIFTLTSGGFRAILPLAWQQHKFFYPSYFSLSDLKTFTMGGNMADYHQVGMTAYGTISASSGGHELSSISMNNMGLWATGRVGGSITLQDPTFRHDDRGLSLSFHSVTVSVSLDNPSARFSNSPVFSYDRAWCNHILMGWCFGPDIVFNWVTGAALSEVHSFMGKNGLNGVFGGPLDLSMDVTSKVNTGFQSEGWVFDADGVDSVCSLIDGCHGRTLAALVDAGRSTVMMIILSFVMLGISLLLLFCCCICACVRKKRKVTPSAY